MKAIVYTQYGSPDVLQLQEMDKPTPGDDEALVSVVAASVNSWDLDLLKGTPLLNRIGGIFKPKHPILGCDIAGRVEAVGGKVKGFQPGDEVLGDISRCGWGGFAEYVCARENALVHKPAGMSFEDAAALPQAGVLALQGLRYKGRIQPGNKVLINGAGGGVGTFAIQMAKMFGSEVTGVDSAHKLDLMRSLGADHVIDYARADFTRTGQRYDLIVDVMANRSIFDYRRALNPKGIFSVVGGSDGLIFQALMLGPLIRLLDGRKMGLMLHKVNTRDLDVLKTFIASGRVAPVVDRCYPLKDLAEAFRYLAGGRARGKVVITVERTT